MACRPKTDGDTLSHDVVASSLGSLCSLTEVRDEVAVLFARIGKRFSIGVADAIVDALDAALQGVNPAEADDLLRWAEEMCTTGAPVPLWTRARLLGLRREAAAAWDEALAAVPAIIPEGLVHRARVRVQQGNVIGAAIDLRLALSQPTGYALWAKAEKVARRLCDHTDVTYVRSLKLALIGGVGSVSLLAPLLRVACFRDGIKVQLYVADYGVWQQEIIDPQSGLYRFAPDVAVVTTHWRDAELPAWSSSPAADVDAVATRFHGLWQRLRQYGRCSILAQTFDLPSEDPFGRLGTALPTGRGAMLRAVNQRLRDTAGDGVVLLDLERLAGEVGSSRWADLRSWFASRQHPAPTGLVPLVEAHVAHLRAILGLTKKVLALDLDNTLWGGVLGEDGLDGIQLGPPSAVGEAYQHFQRYLKELRARGVLLAVCSKNNPADAREPFQRHPETVLRLDDFILFVANWQDKAANLREIASTLSLGLDSFVFVDDNPTERAWVRERLPEVVVPELPQDPAEYVGALERGRYFEALSFSEEDRRRHESYTAEVERQRLEANSASLDEFLGQLGMVALHGEFDAANFARIAQLVNKTNQFNLTTRRYNEAQLRDMAAAPGWWTQWFRLQDRYGDAGLVGVMICQPHNEEQYVWEIDVWLLSCRVLGRRLEEFMFNEVISAARSRGIKKLVGHYIPTAKNSQVEDLFPRLGFVLQGHDVRGAMTWSIDVAQVVPRCVQIADITRP